MVVPQAVESDSRGLDRFFQNSSEDQALEDYARYSTGLTQDEFERELYARRPDLRPPRPGLDISRISRDDLEDLLPDFFEAHQGRGNLKTRHPMVNAILRDSLSLGDLATRSGLSTADFAAVTTNALSGLMVSKFEPYLKTFETFSRGVNAANFKPQHHADVSTPEPAEAEQEGELKAIKATITEGARRGQLRVFGGRLGFSRQLWLTFGVELAEAVASYADVFAQIELRLVAEAIEAGSPPTASGGCTVAGLGAAAKVLRDDLNAAGQKCGLGAHCWMVPPALEATARQLRYGMGNWPANIVVNQFLTSDTTSFLFADPALSSPLWRYRLRDSGMPKLFANSKELWLKTEFVLSHEVDFVLSPTIPGLVKLTT